MQKYNIVILSNQFYDQPLKTNKWHVATRLAEFGHNVIFIDPPTRLRKLVLSIISVKNLLSFGSAKVLENTIQLFTPINFLNFRPFSKWLVQLQVARIKKMLSFMDNNPTVLWVYHFDYPELEELIHDLPHDLLIYDVVDEYSAFPEYARKAKMYKGILGFVQKIDDYLKEILNQRGLSGKEWVVYREDWLSKKADLVFASAPGLVNKFVRLLGDVAASKVYFMPNSGDYNRYKDVKEHRKSIPSDLELIPRPRILYSGAIDSYKMNLDLVEACAKAYPDYSFVFLGPERVSDPDLDLRNLKSLSNVSFLGVKAYELMPKYMSSSDVFIIPYNLNEYTVGGCFPVKFHDALSAGLPTVVTNLPAYKPFVDVCYIAKSDSDFVKLIDEALKEDSSERFKKRQEVAKANSWEGKVTNQLSIISTQLQKKHK